MAKGISKIVPYKARKTQTWLWASQGTRTSGKSDSLVRFIILRCHTTLYFFFFESKVTVILMHFEHIHN